jgi:hypothetical protein
LGEKPLASRRYAVGQQVHYTSGIDRAGSQGAYTVVSYVPFDGDEHRYRIKREQEPFERVAKESQLGGLDA